MRRVVYENCDINSSPFKAEALEGFETPGERGGFVPPLENF